MALSFSIQERDLVHLLWRPDTSLKLPSTYRRVGGGCRHGSEATPLSGSIVLKPKLKVDHAIDALIVYFVHRYCHCRTHTLSEE